ncbi:RNA helicase [Dorcoceras hygrometricum]|uniref:RNA helicase n=1 Tax=Dorcoceras hygrometricum TaxID=472368 RepID=A0A2Z7BG11_9LAMI|nr:RNA helicase [Dorcoceras hygrometricum]
MASSTFTNANLVDFKSVLNIPDNEGMQNMFKALESSGLRDIAIGSVMVAENRLEDCISEDIYQRTSLLYRGSFLPTDIETVQEMFADTRSVRLTFALNRFGNSKFNGTSFAINRYDDVSYSRVTDMMTSALLKLQMVRYVYRDR